MQIRILQLIIVFIAIFTINSVSGLVKADIYKKEGKESLKKNFTYLAVDKFSKALKLSSSDGEARGYLGIAYTNLAEKNLVPAGLKRGRDREFLKKAVYEIKDALKTYEDPTINYNLANTYELSGDIDSAIQEAVKSYNQIPSDLTKTQIIKLYKIKGDMLLTQNKKDAAIKFYTKVVELKWLNVTNEDMSDYEFFRGLMPDNFFVRYCLVRLYMEQNLWDKAVIELEYVKNKIGVSNDDITGKLIYIYYNLGKKYYHEAKFKEAKDYLKYIINADGINRFGYSSEAINILSSIYEQTEEIEKAIETWIKLEEIDTQKGQGYYRIGYLFMRKSNLQKAIEYLEKYLPFSTVSDAGIFSTLGNLYEQIGNINKAVEIYRKLEGINNYKGQGHYYIGLLYEKRERWNEAIREFEYVSELRPQDSQILFKLGQFYEKAGNNIKALEIYKKVVLMDPIKEIELNYLLARLYERLEEREKALSLFKKNKML